MPRPIASTPAFRGRLIGVDIERWPSGEREVVRHLGACAVVAITPAGEVLLVRQFREAVREELLEIPAGIFDVEGEDGPTCAARELVEETGHRATRIDPLATIYTSPGFADERIEVFLVAAEARPAASPAEEGIALVRLRLEDAVAACAAGDIKDAKSIAGLLLAAGMLNADPDRQERR